MMSRVVALVAGGSVVGRGFQPYQAHIPYHLQWMIACNLVGMGFVDIGKATFRPPLPARPDTINPLHFYANDASLTIDASSRRTSKCELELDCTVEAILNPHELAVVVPLAAAPHEVQLVRTLASLWEDERTRRRALGDSSTITAPGSDVRIPATPDPELKRVHRDALATIEALASSVPDTQSPDDGDEQAYQWNPLLKQVLLDGSEPIPKQVPGWEEEITGDAFGDWAASGDPLENGDGLTCVMQWMLKQGVSDDEEEEDVEDSAMIVTDPVEDGEAEERKKRRVSSIPQRQDSTVVDIEDVGFVIQSDRPPSISPSSHPEWKQATFFCSPPSIESLKESRGRHFFRASYKHPFFSSPDDVPKAPPVFPGILVPLPVLGDGWGTQRDANVDRRGYDGSSNLLPFDTRSEASSVRSVARIQHAQPPRPLGFDHWRAVHLAATGRTEVPESLRYPTEMRPPMKDAGRGCDTWGPSIGGQWKGWTTLLPPPKLCTLDQPAELSRPIANKSQISAEPPANTLGFDFSFTHDNEVALHGNQHLVVMSIEMLAVNRPPLRSDPAQDAVLVVACSVKRGDDAPVIEHALFVLDPAAKQTAWVAGVGELKGVRVHVYRAESSLLMAVGAFVSGADPDFLISFEAQTAGLGYLLERSDVLGVPFAASLSRLLPEPNQPAARGRAMKDDSWGWRKQSGIHIPGRIVLNAWRIMRAEVKLGIYTFENTVFHVLHRRLPLWPNHVLVNWFNPTEEPPPPPPPPTEPQKPPRVSSGRFAAAIAQAKKDHLDATGQQVSVHIPLVQPPPPPPVEHPALPAKPSPQRWRTLSHILSRSQAVLEMLEATDWITRTSEFARVFGVEFFSVVSRGSQYRVESMLMRLSMPQGYIAISPSPAQVASQAPITSIPLILEPQSKLYTDPVIVFDFQSLYPSIMIAYNLCYSTCLGRVSGIGQDTKLGVSHAHVEANLLHRLRGDVFTTPNGVMFVKPEIRPGVIPRMVKEILETRVMVKKALKLAKERGQKRLARLLDARQKGLKMIANVTYGYTSASFSGRMPCVEISDSIVEMGRYTLQRAIQTVDSNPKWGARVVYGDTDSMFVCFEGATMDDAWRIGREIQQTITRSNPAPITLKLEKVYLPCVLVTKKRYAGYAYESPDQTEPTFDPKGLELVRRDTCPAVAKVMDQSLRLLFDTRDLSMVKQYLQRQFSRIVSGHITLQDFVYAKEVKMGTYAAGRSPPPAAIIAAREMTRDPRAEPMFKERVRYVVKAGPPGTKLMDLVVAPVELMDPKRGLQLNTNYYIGTAMIPALSRIFSLVGANVLSWFNEMPRLVRRPAAPPERHRGKKKLVTIDHFYSSLHCVVCGTLSDENMCASCSRDSQFSTSVISTRLRQVDKTLSLLLTLCHRCSLSSGEMPCQSLDCPVVWRRRGVMAKRKALDVSFEMISQYLCRRCASASTKSTTAEFRTESALFTRCLLLLTTSATVSISAVTTPLTLPACTKLTRSTTTHSTSGASNTLHGVWHLWGGWA